NIDIQVIEKIYEMTNGQPGLVSWFGELLTEKYNKEPEQIIDIDLWKEVYAAARDIEHNNTVQNIIAKAKDNHYKHYVLDLFQDSDIPFSFDENWCNYMYIHGLISYKKVREFGAIYHVCQFSSPFIQSRLFQAFSKAMRNIRDKNTQALEPLDLLEDVFTEPTINIPLLLERYKAYLKRLKDHGTNPWANQPRRKSDYHLTESVGHFHLFHWLQMALGKRCAISPEFPTGNGKVDLHLCCNDTQKGLIEVKSFINAYEVKKAISQAANYAREKNYHDITVAMFVPFTDEHVLNQISVSKKVDYINVNVVAIGQG
ncbi:MAG: hypothetical protein HQK75_18545, partial [Candidatus Magnetomorum sp.]|nr:hypothetical protein [Candidatus Magnetomorum sp.]